MRVGLLGRIAWRFFRSKHLHRSVGFFSKASIAGIAVGVAVLIVVLSAMNGFEQALTQRFLNVVTHAEVTAMQDKLHAWRQSISRIEQMPGVVAAAPEIKVSVLTRHAMKFIGFNLHAIEPVWETKVSTLAQQMSSGAWDSLQDNAPNLVIGQGLAKQLGMTVGDTLVLFIPSNQQHLTAAPLRQAFTITGIFAFGGQLDHERAYAPRAFVGQLLGDPNWVSSIKIKVADIFQAPHLIQLVGSQFMQGVYLTDWTRQDLYQDIQLVRFVVYVVLCMVVGVACFNIVSTLVMAVRDKQSEIAILMTMGMSASRMMLVFMLQGMLYGIVGISLGLAVGVTIGLNLGSIVYVIEALIGHTLLSSDIYFIDTIPAQVLVTDVITVAAIAAVMTVLASIYPAWRSSRVLPATALSQAV
ncbi:MAG: lipoprotein-releasing ABC transporter permease subunit [Shewanellaceae bacterium]|nr:lipoprotein-releasing ABC transporter permease subunit [Shewanellaceae bacterium]